MSDKKQKIYQLLKGIETGDPESVSVVNEAQYIQHNPQTKEGGAGLAELFASLAKTHPRVEIVRLFEDGDFVFGQTVYNFSQERVGFEVFRFEGEQVVEHWDNIQLRIGDMVGGQREADDHHLTESNRKRVSEFVENVMIDKNGTEFTQFVKIDQYKEHGTGKDLEFKCREISYQKIHRVLAEGNFVLAVCEVVSEDEIYSHYDLFRLDNQHIVEHWETIEKVPPKNEWKNDNGKF